MKYISYLYKLLLCILLLFGTDALKASEGFSLIPAGTFTMGNGSNDAPSRTVTLDSLYMGKNEVNGSEWDRVRNWALSKDYIDLPTGSSKGSNHPIHTISWHDAVKWCNARSEMEGLTPVYYTDDAQTQIYRAGVEDITNTQVKWSANGYRLPTEAEWEKAARGGLSGKKFPWDDTITHSDANFYDNGPHPSYVTAPEPYTSPAGSFAANGYDLYDVAGNVYEWCWNRFGAYAAGDQTNPYGALSGDSRVYRGGAWNQTAATCEVARRQMTIPTYKANHIGFRLARNAADTDYDSDGLVYSVETNTGYFVSETDTGTDPNNPDTDGDGYSDGEEVEWESNPNYYWDKPRVLLSYSSNGSGYVNVSVAKHD